MIDTRHPKKMLRLAQLELCGLAPVEGMKSSATARAAVLAGLWSHHNAATDSAVWPSQRLLADLAGGASVSTVQRALHDLEALGLFQRAPLTAAERGRRETTRYHLRLSSHWGGSKGGTGSSGSSGSKGGIGSSGSSGSSGSKGGTGSSGSSGSSGSKGGIGSSGSKADLMRRATLAAEADRLEGAAAAAAAAAKQAEHIALLRAGDPAALARREAEYAWAESLRLEGLAAQRARVAASARSAWVVERDRALERLRAILEETEADDETGSTGSGEIGAVRGPAVDGGAGDAGSDRDCRRTGPAGPLVVVGTSDSGLAAEAPDAPMVDAAYLGLRGGSVALEVLVLEPAVLELEPDGRSSAAAPAVAARPAIEADDWVRARRAELKRQLAGVLAVEVQRAATLARWSGAAVLALVFVFGLFSSVLGSAKGPALGAGMVSGYLTGSVTFREVAGGRVDQADEVRHVNRGSDSGGGRCCGGLVVELGTAGGGNGASRAASLRHGSGAGCGRGAARAALLSGVAATALGSVGPELGAGGVLALGVGNLRGAVARRGGGVLAGVSAGLIAGAIGGNSRDCAGDQASQQVSPWGAEGSREPDLRRACGRASVSLRAKIRSPEQAPEQASG